MLRYFAKSILFGVRKHIPESPLSHQFLGNLDNLISPLSLIFSAFIYYSGYNRSKIQWCIIEGNTLQMGKYRVNRKPTLFLPHPLGSWFF